MKNVQIIDGADNAAYDVYACTEEEFDKLFPGRGQNIEFIEDVVARLGEDLSGELLAPVLKRPLKKQEIVGIHATLFYELAGKKREFYPNKSEADLDCTGRGWAHG